MTDCKHRWHYHDGSRHCFKCHSTEHGVEPPLGGAENEGGFTPSPAPTSGTPTEGTNACDPTLRRRD